jgi:hypothetical protein
MDQQNPNNPTGGDSAMNPGSGTAGWSGTTGSGSMGGNAGTTGSGTTGAGAAGTAGGFGVSSGTDTGHCPQCGQSLNRNAGLEQFLSQLGIDDEMINKLRTQFQDVNIDEYLDTAREYLKESGNKASVYAKENPGKVAAGVAALAVGAGLIYASMHRK